MLNKPITLKIHLSFSQAKALLSQLKQEIKTYEDPSFDELKNFQKWKEENKNG